jgi:small GTP-binding protein
MEAAEHRLKLILVGSTGVGKTCLVNRFVDDVFDPSVPSTVAPAFCSKSVKLSNGREVDLHVWDTAGQERFRAIGVMFYRDAGVAFVCFDNMTISTIPDWVALIREQVTECIIVLVGTKGDTLNDDETAEFLSAGNRKKDDVGAKAFFLTSAKENVGVQEAYCFAAGCIGSVATQIRSRSVIDDPGPKPKDRGKCSC